MTRTEIKYLIIIPAAILLVGTGAENLLREHAERKYQIQMREAAAEYMASLRSEDYTTYTHPIYGFSFYYPKDFTLQTFPAAGGDLTLVQSPTHNMWFKIYVSPFNEPGPLTKERIQIGLPRLVIEDFREYWLKDGAPAVLFSSEDPVDGETRELWLIREGHLYQISMHHPDEEWLDGWIREIASNLTFQEL